MKTEKLLGLLNLLNGVKLTKWTTVMKIVELISGGQATVIDKKWNDEWKQSKEDYYPLDLSNIKTWSTFDDTCIELLFLHDALTNKFICKVKIYEGDSFNGYRTKLRFEATLHLPNEFITVIENSINWKFEQFLEDEYENHLEAQKKEWINKMKNEIITNCAVGF